MQCTDHLHTLTQAKPYNDTFNCANRARDAYTFSLESLTRKSAAWGAKWVLISFKMPIYARLNVSPNLSGSRGLEAYLRRAVKKPRTFQAHQAHPYLWHIRPIPTYGTTCWYSRLVCHQCVWYIIINHGLRLPYVDDIKLPWKHYS